MRMPPFAGAPVQRPCLDYLCAPHVGAIPNYHPPLHTYRRGIGMGRIWSKIWSDERGQDIAEYAVMLAVILVIAVGTIQLVGSNSNTVFSAIGSSIQ